MNARLLCTAAAAALSLAGRPAEGQTRYSFRNPAPADRLRDLSTDRPDRTESPFTVDGGHWQIELDALSYTDAVRDGVGDRALGVGAINLKAGLLHNVDLQLVTELYTMTRAVGGTGRTSHAHLTDLTGRLKLNLWGNDGGRSAFAVMPFVTTPVNPPSDEPGRVTGGLILPLAIEVGALGIGLMSEIDLTHRASDGRRVVSTLHTATVSRDLGSRLGVYTELAAERSSSSLWIPTFDTGLTWAAREGMQLDVGANFGLNAHAPRFTTFLGVSRRY